MDPGFRRDDEVGMTKFHRVGFSPPYRSVLVVDDAVDFGALVRVGHEHVETVAFETTAIEILLHREARREQTDRRDIRFANAPRGRVRDMDDRHADRGLDDIEHAMHRVRAKHERLGARTFERLRRAGEHAAGGVPVTNVLQPFDLREVDAVEHERRGVQSTEPLAHALVDVSIVRERRFPVMPPRRPSVRIERP